jgi:RimJ/RimL family protein N-acetyltransferase
MRFPNDVPVLTDGVVTLRAHGEDDVPGVLEQSTDPVSRAWTTVPVHYTRDDAKRFVRDAMPGGWLSDQEWGFAVTYDGGYAATVSLRNEGEGRAEIAYGSHPRIRGTGAMERALRLLLDWGFGEDGPGLVTVVWWANRGNWPSRRLAWRLGFTTDATLRSWLPQRGELLDAWAGTLLRTDERRPRNPWPDAPTIESPRLPLRLRRARDGDAARMTEACADPLTAHWLGDTPQPYDCMHAEAFLVAAAERRALGEALHLVAADSADDRLLGLVGLTSIDPVLGSAELGFWVHPDARGHGVATESTRLAIRHALLPDDEGGLGLVRVTARAAVGNDASLAVLRHVGMRHVGTLRLASRTRDGLADAELHETVDPALV